MTCYYFQKKGQYLTDNVIFEKNVFFQLVQNFMRLTGKNNIDYKMTRNNKCHT